MDVSSVEEMQADRAFFARLGFAFAVSILVSGVMMVAVGPASQSAPGETSTIALNVHGTVAQGR